MRPLILAPRTAARVYALAESAKDVEDNGRNQIIIIAHTVCDSARAAVKLGIPATWANLLLTPKRIMSRYTVPELSDLYVMVLELEGVKKKVPTDQETKEPQSVEQFPAT